MVGVGSREGCPRTPWVPAGGRDGAAAAREGQEGFPLGHPTCDGILPEKEWPVSCWDHTVPTLGDPLFWGGVIAGVTAPSAGHPSRVPSVQGEVSWPTSKGD